jgi:RNA polymerase sigma factor (sigma-70 family)
LDKDERASLKYDPFNMIDDDEKHNVISESDRERIEAALSILSPLESEVYLMSRGKCISYKNIGKMLGIKETTVASKIERAEKKLAKFRKEAWLCSL